MRLSRRPTTRQVHIPLLKHNILTWFPSSGFVSASRVGAKNIASSSGCAMSRHIRLLYNVGKDCANGEADVDERVQINTANKTGAVKARAAQLKLDIATA
jgi:hypothetical protein